MEQDFVKYSNKYWDDPKTKKSHYIIAKEDLQKGHYYVGHCRNARVARWDGERFFYWRAKFGKKFVEPINHPEDDDGFDLFLVEYWLCGKDGSVEVPIKL